MNPSPFNPVALALRHPVSVTVGVLALLIGGVLSPQRTKVDVFSASTSR